jgi:hypothetical protein
MPVLPPVNRSEQFAGLLRSALVTPEACEAYGGAERRVLSLLTLRFSFAGTLKW